ncbi:transcriptional regulator with XRE-family HTH domain [Lederbergia galactosidilyticus]|uniref:helix-turn-helix domain-containing protein n=1 Tax=Lederbergia galactosidilytica TaxID=217031 RepID=UPI001AE1A82D|nr:helix-turn-helix transcriptional regulator [Lederbergia galactosidilytica]MBP1917401.1 transcriptional regulator with XRE-family HTH domain [Lederbergia galactosidilytica]
MHVLGERLKDLRIENGYKQEDLAKLINVTTSAYGYYEQGRNEPSLESIIKIAKFYKVSVDYLLGLINTPNHSVQYTITEDLSLNELELHTLKKLKDSFLKEISVHPEENVEKLHRYWEFMKNEH